VHVNIQFKIKYDIILKKKIFKLLKRGEKVKAFAINNNSIYLLVYSRKSDKWKRGEMSITKLYRKNNCKKNHTLSPVAIGTLLNTYSRKWASGPTLVSLRRLFIRIK